ncbi:MAG TPA: flagellin [Limnochordia bacterium]|nr:flagellin [Limnochordia bacterium]
MRINNNIMAMNAHRQLAVNQANGAKSMERLSSGMRINRAGDDAAGLAISEKMRGQIRGLKQAQRNAQDGISLIQTAEGALNETHAILQRMRELATQAANDTNTPEDRAEIQKEIDQLAQEITRISTDTEFNTQKLLNGDLDVKFHIGANQDQNISLSIGNMDADSLMVSGQLSAAQELTALDANVYLYSRTLKNITITFEVGNTKETTAEFTAAADDTGSDTITVTLAGDGNNNIDASLSSVVKALKSVAGDAGVVIETGEDFDGTKKLETKPGDINITALSADTDALVGINVSSQQFADQAITTIDNAIQQVSAERSKLGAYQNRLEHTIANLGTSAENLQAAESRIRDLDMAEEIMAFTKNNILQQAATAMLAQANMAPQSVLQLLG